MVKTILRDKRHLAFIRTLPCTKCSATPCDAAHLHRKTDGGVGLKPGDKFVTPLCRDCHQFQHQHGEQFFWKDIYKAKQLCLDLYEKTGKTDECIEIIIEFRKGWIR